MPSIRDIRFTLDHDRTGIGNVIGVLEKPRLWVPTDDYPDYHEWLEKVETELDTESKRAMLVYAGREPVGTLVYQKHKSMPQTVEIKNISVSPDVRGRYVSSYMLRHVEVEALTYEYPEFNHIVVDTKASNASMLGFLITHDYRPVATSDLYGLGAGDDVLLRKQNVPI